MRDVSKLPSNLPVPKEDGAATHLADAQLPTFKLISTTGTNVTESDFVGRNVLFIYPRAGSPLEPSPDPEMWDATPGARGCTPQSCGFRDNFTRFEELGVKVFGLSVQTPEVQLEFVRRNELPYPILSDYNYHLADALDLPDFNFDNQRLLKRMALYIEDKVIKKVFYPVFPPDQNAAEVLRWLEMNGTEAVDD